MTFSKIAVGIAIGMFAAVAHAELIKPGYVFCDSSQQVSEYRKAEQRGDRRAMAKMLVGDCVATAEVSSIAERVEVYEHRAKVSLVRIYLLGGGVTQWIETAALVKK